VDEELDVEYSLTIILGDLLVPSESKGLNDPMIDYPSKDDSSDDE